MLTVRPKPHVYTQIQTRSTPEVNEPRLDNEALRIWLGIDLYESKECEVDLKFRERVSWGRDSGDDRMYTAVESDGPVFGERVQGW